jgi:hypothetical protein
MRAVARLAAAGVMLILALGSVHAQLSFSATYDDDRQVRLEGLVTRVDWVNPRAYMFVNVRDAGGVVAHWAVEIGNPLELERGGWKQSAVRAGDTVVVEGNPARGAALRAFARSVVLKRTGARVFGPATPRRAAAGAGAGGSAVPRWPDGHVRLGAAPGQKGYWGSASARALVESSAAKVAMDDDGLLTSLADADRVAPFLPWARAVYLYRQRTLLADDPIGRCLPPGGPRQFHSAVGFQFVEQPEIGRILVLFGGGNRNWRVIHTDGRPVAQPDEAVPSYFGNSVGRWEQDTLVVDSVGYNERFWMTSGGLPHTEALHLVERFTRTDSNTLRYEVTVDDPRTYARRWTGGWTVQWVAGQEMQEYFCEENAESTFAR